MTTATTLAPVAAVYAVLSTPPTTEAADMRYIVSTRRSTKQNPVPEGERYRAIVQHATILAVPSAECATRFYGILQAAIDEMAVSKLAALVKETPALKEVNADQFTMAAILAHASEKAASLAIDAVKVSDWFKLSHTYKALLATSEQLAASWLAKLPKIAAPNYRSAKDFNPSACASIVSKLHDEDLDSPIAQFIMSRCNAIITDAETNAF
jgi:hypothetical protein